MISLVDLNAQYASAARPGSWNDPDMLEVGNGGMTDAEYKAHFSLWAMMAAPLIAGNDLASMSSTTKDILTNAEVIAIDQDPWGYQGHRIQGDNGLEVWFRPLAGVGQRAVLLFNRSDNAANLTAKWSDIGLAPGKATVRDVWLHLDRGEQTDEFTATVLKHDAVMLKISGEEPEPPHGSVSLSDLTWTYAANGWGLVEKDRSVNDLGDHDGHTLTIGGLTYTKGLGVHGGSLIRYRLGGRCTRLRADIGIDDEVGGDGSVVFHVIADGKSIYDSVLMKKGSRSSIDLDVTGVRELKLSVDNGGDGGNNDHADWANPVLDCVP
jgi:alpha-galactosidase